MKIVPPATAACRNQCGSLSPRHHRNAEAPRATAPTRRSSPTGAAALAGNVAAKNPLSPPASVISASARTAGGSPSRFQASAIRPREPIPRPSARQPLHLTLAAGCVRFVYIVVSRYTSVSDDGTNREPATSRAGSGPRSLHRDLRPPARTGDGGRDSARVDLDRLTGCGHEAGADPVSRRPDHHRNPGQLLGGPGGWIFAATALGLGCRTQGADAADVVESQLPGRAASRERRGERSDRAALRDRRGGRRRRLRGLVLLLRRLAAPQPAPVLRWRRPARRQRPAGRL